MAANDPLKQTNDYRQLPVYFGHSFTGRYEDGGDYLGTLSRSPTLLNMIPYLNKDPVSNTAEIVVEKRQGLGDWEYSIATKSGLSGTMACRDFMPMSTLPDVHVAAFYRNNSGTKTIEIAQIKPTANTWVLIGTISTTAGPPAVTITEETDVYLSEIKVGNVVGVAVVITDKDGASGTSAGYYALSTSGAFTASSLTKISDADFPTNQTPYVHIVGKIVQMNQIAYVMASDGRIYNSTTDTVGTWSALGFLEAEAYVDKGIGLERYKNHIVGFGAKSIEFFNDVGNDPATGSPLQRMDQAFIKFGALYAKSIINIDDNLYWIGFSGGGLNDIWKLDGYTPVGLGTQTIITSLEESFNETNYSFRNLSLQEALFNGKKILFINAHSYDPFILQTSGYLTNETGETAIRASVRRVNAWMYNIKDGLWCSFNYSGNSGASYLDYALFYFSYDHSANITLCLLGDLIATPDAYCDALMYINYDADYVGFTDWSEDDGVAQPIACAWATPLLDFATEKRKFLHKFNILSTLSHRNTGVTGTEYYKLVTYRDWKKYSNAIIHCRNIAVPLYAENSPRIYGNRWGNFRAIQLGFYYQGKGAFAMRGAEIDLSQGLA